MIELNKYIFGAVTITALVGLQAYAWYSGHDGTVQAAIFGLITGITGFIIGKKKS